MIDENGRLRSSHWPGIGKYVGTVDDEKPILFNTGKDFNKFEYYDKSVWQKRRIYLDEVPGKYSYSNKIITPFDSSLIDEWIERTKSFIEDES